MIGALAALLLSAASPGGPSAARTGGPPAAQPAVPEPYRVSAAERAELARILAEPRFARARLDQGRLGRWLARLWDALADLLSTEEAERFASRGRIAFFAAAAAAALALGIRALRRRAARRRRPAGGDALAAPPPSPDAGEGLEAALGAGDPAGAVRAAFLHALGALERSGALATGRSLTNGEMARRVLEAAPASAADFAELARAFDRAVYGGARPSPESAASCAALARRLAARAAGVAQ